MLTCAKLAPAGTQRDSIGRFFRAEAAITAAGIGWTDGTAAGMGYWTKARRASRNHDTDCASQFALHTDAVRRSVRLAPVQKSADDLDKLVFVDRTTT